MKKEKTKMLLIGLVSILLVVLIAVVLFLNIFIQKETINVSPVKVKIDGAMGTVGFSMIQFEIISGNVLDVKTQIGDKYVFKTKKLSQKDCKEINLMLKNIMDNRNKIHKPSSVATSDGIHINATIGDEVYLNLYGRYGKELDDLDWLTYKLLKESPVKFERLENRIKFPEKYESN